MQKIENCFFFNIDYYMDKKRDFFNRYYNKIVYGNIYIYIEAEPQ